jgi:hypothetical protein
LTLLQHFDGQIRQWQSMFSPALGPTGRDDPHAPGEIDLGPSRVQDLTEAHGQEKLQSIGITELTLDIPHQPNLVIA